MWSVPQVSGPSPSARWGHSATKSGTKIVFVGGFDGTNMLDTVHILGLETMVWSKMDQQEQPSPSARAGHSATCAADGRVFVFGGGDGSDYLNDLWVFTPETMEWKDLTKEVKGTPPAPRSRHTAELGSGNKIFVFGGGSNSHIFDDLFILDIETLEWTQPTLPPVRPGPRWGHTCTPVGERNLFFFGGVINSRMLNELWMLDTETLTWSLVQVLGPPAAPRAGHTCTASGKHLYVLWGGDNHTFINGLYVLDTDTMRGTHVLFNSPVSRCAHSASLLEDGHVLVFGGGNGARRFKELYLLSAAKVMEMIMANPGSSIINTTSRHSRGGEPPIPVVNYAHQKPWAETESTPSSPTFAPTANSSGAPSPAIHPSPSPSTPEPQGVQPKQTQVELSPPATPQSGGATHQSTATNSDHPVPIVNKQQFKKLLAQFEELGISPELNMPMAQTIRRQSVPRAPPVRISPSDQTVHKSASASPVPRRSEFQKNETPTQPRPEPATPSTSPPPPVSSTVTPAPGRSTPQSETQSPSFPPPSDNVPTRRNSSGSNQGGRYRPPPPPSNSGGIQAFLLRSSVDGGVGSGQSTAPPPPPPPPNFYRSQRMEAMAALKQRVFRPPPPPAAPLVTDIGAWLQSLGLEKYLPNFQKEEIDVQTLPHLMESDLIKMGITTLGPRRKILTALGAVRIAPAANTPPGLTQPSRPYSEPTEGYLLSEVKQMRQAITSLSHIVQNLQNTVQALSVSLLVTVSNSQAAHGQMPDFGSKYPPGQPMPPGFFPRYPPSYSLSGQTSLSSTPPPMPATPPAGTPTTLNPAMTSSPQTHTIFHAIPHPKPLGGRSLLDNYDPFASNLSGYDAFIDSQEEERRDA